MSEAQAGAWERAVRSMLDDPEQAELARACYYDAPLEAAAERYRASAEWTAARAFLPPSEGGSLHALDLGAGNGIASFALAADGFRVTAVEPDPSALVGANAIRGLAARTGLPITAVEQWGEQLPFAEASFDVVVARQVLHHARSLPGLCAELHRVLKPGGRLLALRDHVVTDDSQLPAFFAKHPLHKLYGGEYAFTEAAYRGALGAAGFRIAQTLRAFDSPINMEPLTPDGLAAMVAARMPPAGPVARLFARPAVWGRIAPLLSAMDRRPGRLISFIADRAA